MFTAFLFCIWPYCILSFSSLPCNLHHLWYPQMNLFSITLLQLFFLLFLFVLSFIFHYLLHVLRYLKPRPFVYRRPPQSFQLQKPALRFHISHYFTSPFPVSVLQIQGTLQSFAKILIQFPNLSISLYSSALLFHF